VTKMSHAFLVLFGQSKEGCRFPFYNKGMKRVDFYSVHYEIDIYNKERMKNEYSRSIKNL
jgi:hypothetical protein